MRKLLAFGVGSSVIGIILLAVAFVYSYFIVSALQVTIKGASTGQTFSILEDATVYAIFLGIMAGIGYALIAKGLDGIRKQEMMEMHQAEDRRFENVEEEREKRIERIEEEREQRMEEFEMRAHERAKAEEERTGQQGAGNAQASPRPARPTGVKPAPASPSPTPPTAPAAAPASPMTMTTVTTDTMFQPAQETAPPSPPPAKPSPPPPTPPTEALEEEQQGQSPVVWEGGEPPKIEGEDVELLPEPPHYVRNAPEDEAGSNPQPGEAEDYVPPPPGAFRRRSRARSQSQPKPPGTSDTADTNDPGQ